MVSWSWCGGRCRTRWSGRGRPGGRWWRVRCAWAGSSLVEDGLCRVPGSYRGDRAQVPRLAGTGGAGDPMAWDQGPGTDLGTDFSLVSRRKVQVGHRSGTDFRKNCARLFSVIPTKSRTGHRGHRFFGNFPYTRARERNFPSEGHIGARSDLSLERRRKNCAPIGAWPRSVPASLKRGFRKIGALGARTPGHLPPRPGRASKAVAGPGPEPREQVGPRSMSWCVVAATRHHDQGTTAPDKGYRVPHPAARHPRTPPARAPGPG